jgi:hypothetical protein
VISVIYSVDFGETPGLTPARDLRKRGFEALAPGANKKLALAVGRADVRAGKIVTL